MAAIQPNLIEASKEVDTFMAMVEKEQMEVSELEKVVKSEDAVVNEKKKVVESISEGSMNLLTVTGSFTAIFCCAPL